MRIAMIGHKRYGSREGGVEVVVTELARRMAALGHEVTCYDRSGSDVMTGDAADCRERVVDGVRVVPVRTIDKKGLAALSSSYFATLAAIKDGPDVIHYHAEGPCVPLPLAKRAGIRTVATIHGLDWQRAKWGKLASAYIKMGEKAAATKADGLIVLSKSAQSYFEGAYGRTATFIPNGIEPKQLRPVNQIKEKWGLDAGSYLLYLGRLVPEKRPELLIEAFKKLDTDKRLVIAGGGSDTSEYEASLREAAQGDNRIVFTGFVNGEPLEVSGTGGGLNPRTVIGQRADGAVLLLAIDGRQTHSLGASFKDCIDVMMEYGAINAANLDGGSSTMMVYKGETVNSCASMYGSRRLPTAIIVE